MSTANALQTQPVDVPQTLAPGQRRMHTLLRQIELAQTRLGAWQAQQGTLDHLHTMMVLPLQNQVFAMQRKWVFALDRAAHWANWTDAESDTLRQQLCQASMELLLRDAQDAEMKLLFSRYSDTDFADARARLVQRVAPQAPRGGPTARDPQHSQDPASGMAVGSDKAEHAAANDGGAQPWRMSKKQLAARLIAQVRREHESMQLANAARDLYRKLVSDLHPDREPDAALRSSKTELMQQANRAYAHNDVFALLSVQAQADAVGVQQNGGLMPERIRYFNKLLAEQLAALKEQLATMETGVLGKLGLPLQTRCNPHQCEALVKQAVRHWRQRRATLQDGMQRASNQTEAKRWLQQTRQQHLQHVVQCLVRQAKSA